METPSKTISKVIVTGATGFIGVHVCRALRVVGYEVVGLSRETPSPEKRVAGVHYFQGDIRTGAIPEEAFLGCDFIVHLVGIIAENRREGITFEAVHVGGTRNVLRSAEMAKMTGRIVYVSAQGADVDAWSEYSRTKARAEQLVRQAPALDCVIFRPSLVLGPGGEFIRQMEQLIRRPPLAPFNLPFIPVPGNGKRQFQPVAVDDLSEAIVKSLSAQAAENVILPIGGADRVTLNQLVHAIAKRIRVSKRLFHIPLFALFPVAALLERIMAKPPITVDQLRNLSRDNVCDNSLLHEKLGVYPRSFEATLDVIYPPASVRR